MEKTRIIRSQNFTTGAEFEPAFGGLLARRVAH